MRTNSESPPGLPRASSPDAAIAATAQPRAYSATIRAFFARLISWSPSSPALPQPDADRSRRDRVVLALDPAAGTPDGEDRPDRGGHDDRPLGHHDLASRIHSRSEVGFTAP